jgi:hypothetical protein
MMPELRRVVEVGNDLESLVKRREHVDGAFALKRYQERIIRIQRALAIRHDVENTGCEMLGLLSQESHFTAIEPAPHSCNRRGQIGWCRLSLRSTPTKDGQGLEHEEGDENNAVRLSLQPRREIDGALMQRIVRVEQGNDDVGVENNLSHRRVRRCRLLRPPACREPRRLLHGSTATMRQRAASSGALRARPRQRLHAARFRRDWRARAPSHRALQVRVERPRRKDTAISASENQLRAPQDSNL